MRTYSLWTAAEPLSRTGPYLIQHKSTSWLQLGPAEVGPIWGISQDPLTGPQQKVLPERGAGIFILHFC